MSEHNESASRADTAKSGLLESTLRVVIALGILAALQFVIQLVPGNDIVVQSPDVTVATVVYSAITLVMFVAVMKYATSVGAVLGRTLGGTTAVERSVQLIGAVVVLVWAYNVFWWLPYFRENERQYDFAFLVVILLALGWLGYLLYTNVEEITATLTGTVSSTDEPGSVQGPPPASASSSDGRSAGAVADEAAPAADGDEAASEDVESVGSTADEAISCPECGTANSPESNFCRSCGAELTTG